MNYKIYQALQKTFIQETGLKVGDFVTVTKKANDFELGWAMVWVSCMDKAIDQTVQITGIDMDGFMLGKQNELGEGCYFPFHVLEKAEAPTKKITVKGVAGYDAVISPDGITLGCKFVSLEKFKEIAEAVAEVQTSDRIGQTVPFCDVRVGEFLEYNKGGMVYERVESDHEYRGTLRFRGENGEVNPANASKTSRLEVTIVENPNK